MLGAIAGDIIGSSYEFAGIKTKDFDLFNQYSRFTDDTVLTIAVADRLVYGGDYHRLFKAYCLNYPNAGYGGSFAHWATSESQEPYNSWGNGSAMRVSPIGYAFDTLDRVLLEAKNSAVATHNHPEGIKGAQAIASAIFLARTGKSKLEIKDYIRSTFSYNLDRTLDIIRPDYTFEVSCQASVPEAIIAFLESIDFEDAIRNAVSLGGDSDTQACMAGGIAEAFYGGVPSEIANQALLRLDEPLKLVLQAFIAKFSSNYNYNTQVASH
jgi:ADP-ribosylglycohydrolase